MIADIEIYISMTNSELQIIFNLPSILEPVHSSVPDIADLNITNIIGTIWATIIMMQHLGFYLA